MKFEYQAYKFISSCKNGFVLSAKKGKVRYAIKARFNVVIKNKEQVNLLEKNRELPDNLRFYCHPNVLALIESFETKDYHYVVTEECIATFEEFTKEVKPKLAQYSCSFDFYAAQLFQAFKCLSIGPTHIHSSRFISCVRPDDILVGHDFKLKLNPTFGFQDMKIGAYPFCNLEHSVTG